MATEKDLIISDKEVKADQALEARDTKVADAKPFNEALFDLMNPVEEMTTEIEDDIDTTDFTSVDTSGEEVHSDNYYTEKFKSDLGFGVGRDTKMSTPILGLYDKLNILAKIIKESMLQKN